MKFSIANLLLAVAVLALGVVAAVERRSHQKQINDLEIAYELDLAELEEVLTCQHSVENMLSLARWSEDGEVNFHWKQLSLMYVWHLHLNADKINARQILIETHGPNPAAKLAGELLRKLECGTFEEFIDKYKQMEKIFRFKPNPITNSNGPERFRMMEFVDEALGGPSANRKD